MASYYIYRINPRYDGFFPENIDERARRDRFVFNWGAYLDNLERGDIVLVYFTGHLCAPGIYAITRIAQIDHGQDRENVTADLLIHSTNNRAPLFSRAEHRELFSTLMYRPRGAELIVRANNEQAVFDLLNSDDALSERLKKFGFVLPGVTVAGGHDLANVPKVDLCQDLSDALARTGLVAGFWIRPKQATWMRSIDWLTFISQLFYKFKSGDTSFLDEMARTLATNIRSKHLAGGRQQFVAIVPVPLSEVKRDRGEVDRVDALCKCLSAHLGVPRVGALRLTGNVSRVRYKNLGISDAEFRRDYLDNLSLTSAGARLVRRSGQRVLLVDDVFTDGITTALVQSFLSQAFKGLDHKIEIATLGVMSKARNVSVELRKKWHN